MMERATVKKVSSRPFFSRERVGVQRRECECVGVRMSVEVEVIDARTESVIELENESMNEESETNEESVEIESETMWKHGWTMKK